MRRFFLYRKEDPTGMSGTGIVAYGCEYDSGQVALTWAKSNINSLTVFPSISNVEKLHSHNGKDPTKIVWIDPMGEDLEAKAKDLQSALLEELQKEMEKDKLEPGTSLSGSSNDEVKVEVFDESENEVQTD